MAITKDEKIKLCRDDYMNGVPVDDIVSLRKVSKSTFYNWVRKYKWAEQRAEMDNSFMNAPEKLEARIKDLIAKMESTNDPAKVAYYADSFSKLLGVVRRLYKAEDRRSWIIFTLSEMMLFMKNTEIKFTEEFRDMFDKFLEAFQEAMLNKFPVNKYN